MQAYKNYVKMIVTRTNTKTNIKYSEDPTIFALELANEPHTTDNYEIKRGIAPGTIIKAWIKDMVAFIRTLDTKHMVSSLMRSSACLSQQAQIRTVLQDLRYGVSQTVSRPSISCKRMTLRCSHRSPPARRGILLAGATARPGTTMAARAWTSRETWSWSTLPPCTCVSIHSGPARTRN